jgi:parallel beta-helix repeat protein
MPSSFAVSVIAEASDWSSIDESVLEGSGVIWVPDNYSSIQVAVNAAQPGDTIYVRNGTYYESVDMNKAVTLVGVGFPKVLGNITVGMWGYPNFRVGANNVTVSGFAIRNSGREEFDCAIALHSACFCNISGNRIYNSTGSISTDTGCNYNIFGNNTIENSGSGIVCDGAWNYIYGNKITNNGVAILVAGGGSNTLVNNTILNNQCGITLWVNGNTFRGNNMTGNVYGFDLDGGSYLEQYFQDVDPSNLIDGRPMYYWINQHDRIVPVDAGYVALVNCTNITVDGLDLRKNGHGALIAFTANSTITSCNLTDNTFGLYMWASENNTIYHNNFINNTFHVGNPWSWWPPVPELPPNTWDSGYPSGGNYWNSLNATDLYSGTYQNETGSDGISDTVNAIDVNNQDNYPLAAPINIFDAGTWNGTPCKVHIVSNSSISDFQISDVQKTINFNVTGLNDTSGFCRVAIPNTIIQDLWQDNYTILVNNQPVQFRSWTDTENTYLYLTYQHSQHQITIIPETTTLPIIIALTILTVTLKKQKTPKNTTPYSSHRQKQ